MLKIGWFGVIRGHRIAYEFLLAFHSNYVPILQFLRYSIYWSKIADFNLCHLCLVPSL